MADETIPTLQDLYDLLNGTEPDIQALESWTPPDTPSQQDLDALDAAINQKWARVRNIATAHGQAMPTPVANPNPLLFFQGEIQQLIGKIASLKTLLGIA